MAPQCTGMAGWGRFNAMMNPEAHQRSVAVSHHLGTICAKCAILQANEGRHYFLEQPKGSDLLKLPIFQYLAYITGATWCYMDMCMVGLRSSKGKLLKKPTELWASDEHLLCRLRTRLCDGSHEHDTIEGGESKPSQIWTWNFVRTLADGISDLARFEFDASRLHRGAFPTGKPALPREVDPSEIDPTDPRRKWSCRACRNSIEQHDTRHTRDPTGCKWPLVEPHEHTCEACNSDLDDLAPPNISTRLFLESVGIRMTVLAERIVQDREVYINHEFLRHLHPAQVKEFETPHVLMTK